MVTALPASWRACRKRFTFSRKGEARSSGSRLVGNLLTHDLPLSAMDVFPSFWLADSKQAQFVPLGGSVEIRYGFEQPSDEQRMHDNQIQERDKSLITYWLTGN